MTQKSERGVNLEQGETITLRASAVTAATAGTNGTAVYVGGERRRLIFLLNVTAAATDVFYRIGPPQILLPASPSSLSGTEALIFWRSLS